MIPPDRILSVGMYVILFSLSLQRPILGDGYVRKELIIVFEASILIISVKLVEDLSCGLYKVLHQLVDLAVFW